MAGRYRAAGPASAIQRGTPSSRHLAEPRTFAGTPLTVDGITRDAMGSTSLLGSSIPKGLLAATFGANHASDANTLTNNQSFAQRDIAGVIAQLEALSKSRALRAVGRNAEAAPATATGITVESPRLLSHGRGPRIVVEGLTAGDLARVVAMFERFGYTINRAFTPSRLDPMTKMSYWKTDGAAVVGAMPQQKRQTVQQAFDRGVTVWTDIAEIGTDVTGSNAPRAGISY